MRFADLSLVYLAILCTIVVATKEAVEPVSSGLGAWFWFKMIIVAIYIALGVLLYNDRGVSRVFMMYLGLGAVLALLGLLFSIDLGSSSDSESGALVDEPLLQMTGNELIGKFVYVYGLSGPNEIYNGSPAYVKAYDNKFDEYTISRRDPIFKYFSRGADIKGIKRRNLSVHAVIHDNVKLAQAEHDMHLNYLEAAEKDITLKEALEEDSKRRLETAQLVVSRVEYPVGTRVVYAGQVGTVVQVDDSPQGKRYTVQTSSLFNPRLIPNVDISKLSLSDGVGAHKALLAARKNYLEAQNSTEAAIEGKKRLEQGLVKLESKLNRAEALSEAEKDQEEEVKAEFNLRKHQQKTLSTS